MKAYPVAAVFQIGMSNFDGSFVFMPLSEAQAYFNLDGVVNLIEVYLDDPDGVDAMRPRITAAEQRPMIDTDWRQNDRSLIDVLGVEANVMFAILSLIVLVAALNIISGMIMLVQDKARAIAVLRTMGATRGAILRDLPDHRRDDRHRRHVLRPRRSACWSPITSSRSARRSAMSSASICSRPSSISSRNCPRASSRTTSSAVALHGAVPFARRDDLSLLARGAARSGRGAAL